MGEEGQRHRHDHRQQPGAALEIDAGFLAERLELLRDVLEHDIDRLRRRGAGLPGSVADRLIRIGNRLPDIDAAEPFHELGRRHRGEIAAAPQAECPPRIDGDLRGRIGRRRLGRHAHRRTVGAHALDERGARAGQQLPDPVVSGRGRDRRIRLHGARDPRGNIFREHLVEHLPEHVFQPGFAHREDAVNDFDE